MQKSGHGSDTASTSTATAPWAARPDSCDEQREQLVERIGELRAEHGVAPEAPEAPGLELDVDAPERDLGR